ncbi:MAG TPA: hypothetical protein VF708_08065 [Pyrinomonadaceae bacterium]
MKRKTWWVLLTIMALFTPMLIATTSHSDSVKKNIALKQERAKRAGNTQARKMKEVNLTPARGRSKAEQERLAAKKEAAEKGEGRENPMEEIWPREAPQRGILAQRQQHMSAMGRLASGTAPKISRLEDWEGKVNLSKLRPVNKRALESLPAQALSPSVIGSADLIVHNPNEFTVFGINGPSDLGFQSETSIDSNDTGTVLVAGFNDLSGFLLADANGNQSISGVARSTDGGATWMEVDTDMDLPGLLPVGGGDGQIFGDPDVKWSPTLNGGMGGFVYASIFVRNSDGLQGMCINISDPDGDNWSDPIEVDPTFRGGPTPDPSDDDAADKEFIDVNLNTGRILMSWTNFPGVRPKDIGPFPDQVGKGRDRKPQPTIPSAVLQTPITIYSTYSDDAGATWSTEVIVGQNTMDPAGGVQSSIPRFIPGMTNATSQVYIAYREVFSDDTRNVAVNHSTDGGVTYLPNGVEIDVAYGPEDQIPGVDRVNNSPALDVDYDTGRVYVAYQRNNPWQNQPFGTPDPAFVVGDIAMRTFTGAPTPPTMGNAPFLINSDPGKDYAQQYPNVAVDQSNGMVHVNFLDQHASEQYLPSGDVFENMTTYSEDQGATWSPPTAVTDRTFHAGYGNDSSEPNMGDYNQNVAENGRLHSVWGGTSLQPLFTECKNPFAGLMCTPDTYYDKRLDTQEIVQLRVMPESFVEAGNNCSPNGFLDPRERGSFTIPLKNYVTNPNNSPETITGITAVLTTATAGVTIVDGTAAYPDIPAGQTKNNSDPFVVELSSTFVPGTFIDFVLSVTTAQGTTQQMFRTETGTPNPMATTLLNENFDSAMAPALPAGWTQAQGGCSLPGPNACLTAHPWITSNARTPMSQAAFHPNSGTNSEWIRLFSPTMAVPNPGAGVQSYITVDFDLNYSLEDNPAKLFEAFDGLFLRILDGSAPTRSVIAESFAAKINTAGIDHYPAHLVRSNDPAYFADMSVWSDDSIELDNDTDGTIHVSMKFNAETMTGKNIQARFEYTEDSNLNCLGSGGNAPCGIAIDNVLVKFVTLTNGGPTAVADLEIEKTDDADPVLLGENITYHLKVTNNGPDTATNVVVTDRIPSNSTYVSATPSQGSCAPSGSNKVICMLGNMNSGDMATIDIVVKSGGNAGPVTNTATVTSDVCDLDVANNTDFATTTTVTLRKLSFSPPVVTGGCADSTGTLLLTGPAPAGGLVVTLHSNYPQIHVPPTVTVPAGETSTTFTAETDVVMNDIVGIVTATAGSNHVGGRLKVLAVRITNLTFMPNPVHGGQNTTAFIFLSCAPDTPITVRLTSDRAVAMPESPIVIPAGQSVGQATIHTLPVSSPRTATITAYANGGYRRGTLTIIP